MAGLGGFSMLLVDDHPLFREGLALALERHEPGLQLHLADGYGQAAALLGQVGARVDLALVDFRLPGEDGLSVALRLRKQFPEVAYALMSGVDDLRALERTREAGLMGYFPKSLDVAELLDGLRHLAAGRSHFVAPRRASQAPDPLTLRQREILAMVARGATNKEIAQVLQIAPHTVKNHLGQIFDRLGAANRAQAAAIAHDRQHG